MHRIRLSGVLVFAAALTAGAILVALPSGPSAKKASPRGAASAVGVRFTPATPPANALSRADAIAAAQGRGSSLASQNVKVRAAFGVATDTEYYLQRKNGTRHYYVKNRPVWIVTFIGAGLVPNRGPHGGASPNRELNVVVDGLTGRQLEDYSYR
jgi:hypothetical protein